ncbi:unnamed protein product [Bursaphelenchus xylophilus]|nr:unnamed protein product [Bursaphelenchus xylophilus]CAG9122900.1 unnamed protein product [Bursaphelenchus xylophilus]
MFALYLMLMMAMATIASAIGVRPVQSMAVEGNFICNGRPMRDVKVKLYDHDTFTLDDLMAKTKSDSNGHFYLKGHANEVSRVTPKLNIYHRCNQLLPVCYQKFSIGIPKDYITYGSAVPSKTYNLGTLNLDGKFPGQGRDCLN